MNTPSLGSRSPRHEPAEGKRADTRSTEAASGPERAARWLRQRIAWLGLVLVIPAAVAVLAYGCSDHADEPSATVGSSAGTTSTATVASAGAPPASDATPAVTHAEVPAVPEPGSRPPDLVASVIDTLVERGETVEVVVEATPDVAEVALWDGLNDRQAFVYDSHSKLWLADYRVPLRPSAERIAISVTAKTQADRWRRVWVFLRVAPDTLSPD